VLYTVVAQHYEDALVLCINTQCKAKCSGIFYHAIILKLGLRTLHLDGQVSSYHLDTWYSCSIYLSYVVSIGKCLHEQVIADTSMTFPVAFLSLFCNYTYDI
jgi:hypothetical protein